MKKTTKPLAENGGPMLVYSWWNLSGPGGTCQAIGRLGFVR